MARAERRAIAAASATARKAEAERNAAEARRARLESELASLEADLDAHRRGRGDAIQRERLEASRVAAPEREPTSFASLFWFTCSGRRPVSRLAREGEQYMNV